MSLLEKTILVVDQDPSVAENVKELIEFMDAPCVITALPDDWKKRLGDRRLEALFVGPDVSDDEVNHLMDDLSQLDPNVPVIMMQAS